MRIYNFLVSLVLLLSLSLLTACGSEDVPQAHKGRMFDRTGGWAMWSGGEGFNGPIIGPGTYWTGWYDEVRMVDCTQETKKESLSSLTKDGVQFSLDVYITFNTDCSDTSVEWLLDNVGPQLTSGSQRAEKNNNTITVSQMYEMYIRPEIGEAVREAVSPNRANDINDNREAIFTDIQNRFSSSIEKMEPQPTVIIHNIVLSNLIFPNEMNIANTDRAVQSVLKDKTIAEREKVVAEIETMDLRRALSKSEGEKEAAKIDEIGAALKRNPEYLQFDMQSRMEEIYRTAGANGNMVITAPNPTILVNPSHNPPKPVVN